MAAKKTNTKASAVKKVTRTGEGKKAKLPSKTKVVKPAAKTSPLKAVKSTPKPKTIRPQTIPPQTNQLKEIIMNMTPDSKNFEKITKDVSNMSKEAMDACQKSADILAKGSQSCMSTYMQMMQATAERQSNMMKEILSKKTINEVGEMMQSASQETFNEMLANMSKLSEQSIKTAMECMEPLSNQMNNTMQKATKVA